MSLLLDTHVLLWWLAGDPIEPAAAERISDPAVLVAVSAASIWEMAIKAGLGKLRVEGSLVDHVAAGGFEQLAISLAHAEKAGTLPLHHRDPFDRMLVAQAQLEHLTLVTRDPVFGDYEVKILAG
jgi:PIN domain nuclease of toxin-antitoxin system